MFHSPVSSLLGKKVSQIEITLNDNQMYNSPMKSMVQTAGAMSITAFGLPMSTAVNIESVSTSKDATESATRPGLRYF